MFSKLIAYTLLTVAYVKAQTLYLAGDSTMAADDGNAAIIGWGTAVGEYINVPVVNKAVAGRSSRTFTTEGRFAEIVGLVQPNDIVVIEFGHNDGGGPTTSRGVCGGADITETCNVNGTIIYTFNKYIEDAVNSLQAKSAKVIVSSQTPDNPYDVGFGASRFVGYAQTAAEDTGASYVDHFNTTIEEYEILGEDAVNALYPVDHTHTSPTGADIVAQTFIRGVLRDSSNPLFAHVTNKSVVPPSWILKMPFVKKQKSNAYFSRFQVKYRRRREGKTDYYARKRLVTQVKNKYNAPKYRLVVRFTNKQVICQIVYARLQGDFVFAAATSKELPRYGINHGLTNWTAAYATGLLCARRALTKLGLADKYEGVAEPDGELTLTEAIDEEDAPRPFKCFLDVGLRRTSTGSRVFGAMKGASDGGIFIPHSEKRFPGFDIESKELDAEVLKKYIFGGHVAEYMESLEEEDDERFKKQFSTYLADGVGSEDIEEIYTNAYAAIREDPTFKPTEKSQDWKAETLKFKTHRLTREQRLERIQEKIKAFQAGQAAEDDEE